MDEHPNATLIRAMIDDPVNYGRAFGTDDVGWHHRADTAAAQQG